MRFIFLYPIKLLVGGFNPSEKYESNGGRDENKRYLKPPPRLEWHCSFKRRKHRYGKRVNPSGSTKQSSNITTATKHLCHPPPLSILNQNCHLLIVIIGIIIVMLILIHQELIIIKHMVVSLIPHLVCCVRPPPNSNNDRQDYYMLHHRIPINLHLPDPTGPLNIPQALKYLLMKGILSSLYFEVPGFG